MERQPDLFSKSLDERFQEYHEENPLIFRLFERFAREALNAGLKQFGAKAIMEQIRWKVCLSTRDPQGFKINNNYTRRYALLLVEKYPEFEDFFEMRKPKAA